MSDAATEPKVLTPTDLETADCDRTVEPVDVPEWGGRVHVRELTALETGKVEDAVYDEKDQVRAELVAPAWVAACLCDPTGKPFYRPGDTQAILTVGSKSAPVVRRIYEVAARLNGRARGAAAAGKDDSAAAPAGGSPSASPSPSAA